ncbi:MAG TPA: hypothetical protein VGS79_06705 [Puia sp.]|nr:hypothetical protein [Puia sp.]
MIFFLIPVLLQAQDITGIWQGHFRSNQGETGHSFSLDDRYRFEVQIAQRGKTFEAVTYSYLSTFFYGKAAAKGTVNVHTQKVLLQEGKILEVRNDVGGICIMTCFLQYTKSGDEEFLEGKYVSMNLQDSSNCGRGTVFLRKVPTSQFYPEDFVVKRQQEIEDSLRTAAKTPEPERSTAKTRITPKPGVTTKTRTPAKPGTTAKTGLAAKPSGAAPRSTTRTVHPPAKPAPPNAPARNPPPIARATIPKEFPENEDIGRKFPTIVPAVIKDRENEVVKTLVIHTTEVTLNIYDDGAIDNDTVSVYLDNRPVLLHKMLTDRPLVVTLHLDANDDYHEVVMVADNEGTIPPNTSLMIVKAGDKEYEVRITSTEQKNAVIKFQYAK